jgi:hypothetical protein
MSPSTTAPCEEIANVFAPWPASQGDGRRVAPLGTLGKEWPQIIAPARTVGTRFHANM